MTHDSANSPDLVPLSPRELISDRRIQSAEQDRLRHEPFADELRQLIIGVEMPCNIAVYGPWGAGKSGLAKLVEHRLGTAGKKKVRFATFDASKYAGASLRRHFISQLATRLDIEKPRFREDLYSETTDTHITLRARALLTALGFFVSVLLGAALVAVFIAWCAALLAKGPTGDNFNDFAKAALAFATAPAALVAGFMVFAGKTIPVNRKVSAPSSEEEFERLFRALRGEVKTERLVVFIDELDRCSPKDVVATLETVRTFLGVPGCVFVVAADQQVLERALQSESGQATPVDSRNPYYSAGSEYLDKTFQHQLHLPPLLPRRLTQFALDLTEKGDGVWTAVDRAEAIPVLIPTHVHSPRKVKSLLNGYVMSYRIAQRRLPSAVTDRAVELAKLVCLRCEFPLFAADLVRDARLPEYVLAIIREEEIPEHVAEDVRALASQYATGDLPVDELMLDEEDSEHEQREAVIHAQAQQLLNYLQKTEHVPNPARDLLHLESSGALSGLDSAVADELEAMAVNGQRDDVAARVAGLEAAEQQVAALRHLAHVTRELAVGIETRNGVSCLIAAVSSLPELDLQEGAQEIASAVSGHIARYELRQEDLSGAFLLAMRTPLGGADEIVGRILGRDELLTDQTLAGVVTRHLADCLPEHADRISNLVSHGVLRDDDELVPRLAELPRDSLIALLARLRQQLPHLVELSAEEAAADAEAHEGVTEHSAPEHARATVVALTDVLLDHSRNEEAGSALVVLLDLDTTQARHEVEKRLPRVTPIPRGELAQAVLTAVGRRVARRWPVWLDDLADDVVGDDASTSQLQRLGLDLWRKANTEENRPTNSELDAALASLQRLGDARSDELQAAALEAVSVVAQNETLADNVWHAMNASAHFADHELIDFRAMADGMVEAFQGTLGLALPPQASSSPLVLVIGDWLPDVAEVVSTDQRNALQNSLQACQWIQTPHKEAAVIDLLAASRVAGDTVDALIEPAEVVALVGAHPDVLEGPAARWVEHIASPADVASVTAAAGVETPESIVTALHTRAGHDSEDAWSIAEQILSQVPTRVPDPAVMRALGVGEREPGRAATLLVSRYESAGNNPEREAVLRTWSAIRPEESAARKLLIERVFTPTLQGSKGGLEAALRHLDLVVDPPYGTAQNLRNDLLAAGERFGHGKNTRKAMEAAGIIKRSKKRFGLW